MSLLQILQQGIQAKERAQQADIDRGLRELQIGKEEKLQRERLTFQGAQDNLDRQHELLKLSSQIAADRAEQMAGFAFEDRQRIKEQEYETGERISGQEFMKGERIEEEGALRRRDYVAWKRQGIDTESERDYQKKVLEDVRGYDKTVLKDARDYAKTVLIEGREHDKTVLTEDRTYTEGQEKKRLEDERKREDALLDRGRREKREDEFIETAEKLHNNLNVINSEILSGFSANAPTITAENADTLKSNIQDVFKDSFKAAGFDKKAGVNISESVMNALVSSASGNTQGMEQLLGLLYDNSIITNFGAGQELPEYKQAAAIVQGLAALGFDTTKNFTTNWKIYLDNKTKQQNVIDEMDEIHSTKKGKMTDDEFWKTKYEFQRDVVGDKATVEQLSSLEFMNKALEMATIAADLESEKNQNPWDKGFTWDAKTQKWSSPKGFDAKPDKAFRLWNSQVDTRRRAESKYVNAAKDLSTDYTYIVDNVLSRVVQDIDNQIPEDKKKAKAGRGADFGLGRSVTVDKALDSIGFTSPAKRYIGGNNWRHAWESDYSRAILTHQNFKSSFDSHVKDLFLLLEKPDSGLYKGDALDLQKISSRLKIHGMTDTEKRLVIAKEIANAKKWYQKLQVSKGYYDSFIESKGKEREAFESWSETQK